MTLLRQGRLFVLVGLLQLILDWAVFVGVTALAVPVSAGNLLGRLCGAGLGFWLNGRYTFAEQADARLGWHRFLRFAALWVALSVASTVMIDLVASALGLRYAWVAKPLVEGLLALVSFFLWRQLIFR